MLSLVWERKIEINEGEILKDHQTCNDSVKYSLNFSKIPQRLVVVEVNGRLNSSQTLHCIVKHLNVFKI